MTQSLVRPISEQLFGFGTPQHDAPVTVQHHGRNLQQVEQPARRGGDPVVVPGCILVHFSRSLRPGTGTAKIRPAGSPMTSQRAPEGNTCTMDPFTNRRWRAWWRVVAVPRARPYG
ncbi:hypothetical protein GCM10011579_063250 [Streptomyces albiflavescens]|uniref:Uncharacterized protein n=1 Tax=Streptomyces albiflavescens TaxID=1623582 RepID=A0A917YA45_9ACTN|nr:hypothetical protein GCM10011579_063250 [Streptomyces albiflavescens]